MLWSARSSFALERGYHLYETAPNWRSSLPALHKGHFFGSDWRFLSVDWVSLCFKIVLVSVASTHSFPQCISVSFFVLLLWRHFFSISNIIASKIVNLVWISVTVLFVYIVCFLADALWNGCLKCNFFLALEELKQRLPGLHCVRIL